MNTQEKCCLTLQHNSRYTPSVPSHPQHCQRFYFQQEFSNTPKIHLFPSHLRGLFIALPLGVHASQHNGMVTSKPKSLRHCSRHVFLQSNNFPWCTNTSKLNTPTIDFHKPEKGKTHAQWQKSQKSRSNLILSPLPLSLYQNRRTSAVVHLSIQNPFWEHRIVPGRSHWTEPVIANLLLGLVHLRKSDAEGCQVPSHRVLQKQAARPRPSQGPCLRFQRCSVTTMAVEYTTRNA